jgi:hypothetical protein
MTMKWRPASTPGVVDLDDVRVDELRDRERLAAEAGDELLVVGQVLGEDLDGDRPLEHAVDGAVDGRHPAAAEAVAEHVSVGDRGTAHGSLLPSSFALRPAPASASMAGSPSCLRRG